VVLCTIDAVLLGTDAGTAGIAAPGLPVLDDLFRDFVAKGGRVWLCGACTKPRGIGEDHLADGATIVGAARVVEEIVNGARTVAFARPTRGSGDSGLTLTAVAGPPRWSGGSVGARSWPHRGHRCG